MAWLNATPKSDQKARSRRRALDDYEIPVEYPEVDARYVVDYMFDVGISENGVSHEAIRAWMQNIGVILEPWECRFIRSLAGEYVSEMAKAREDIPPPWEGAEVMSRKLTSAKVKETIRGL